MFTLLIYKPNIIYETYPKFAHQNYRYLNEVWLQIKKRKKRRIQSYVHINSFIVLAPQCLSNSDHTLERIRHNSDHGVSWVAGYSHCIRIRFLGHFLGVFHSLDWRSYQWSYRRNRDPERWRHNCENFSNSFVLFIFRHSSFVLNKCPVVDWQWYFFFKLSFAKVFFLTPTLLFPKIQTCI